MSDWKLWYWPGIKGRGEYIRLIFEEAGVPYEDVGQSVGFEGIVDFCFKGGNKGFPVRAPPLLQRGDFIMCNTPAIQSYLGVKLGLAPEDAEGRAHMDQLLAVVTDAVSDGRMAFHPKDFYASHKTQVEESKPYIVQYGEQRLPKYMDYFEQVLRRSGADFLLGDALCVADLAVYQFCAAAQQHFRSYYDTQDTPLLKAHQARIAARPKISAYLGSARCPAWDTDSMM